jgi:PAS domain S-box-containing protein
MLGYLPDELPNDADLWRRLMHPDDLAPMEFVFGSALAQGPDNYETEFRLRTKSGRYMPVLARGHILRNGAVGRCSRPRCSRRRGSPPGVAI